MALAEHRDILNRWILETDDNGRFPESENALRAVIQRWGKKPLTRSMMRSGTNNLHGSCSNNRPGGRACRAFNMA